MLGHIARPSQIVDCKLLLDTCMRIAYIRRMIRSFRSKALADLWNKNSRGVRPDLHKRVRAILSRLEACKHVREMSIAGFHLHPLHGSKLQRYTVSLNGPWRITFEFTDSDAFRVDLEQYH